jgi:hypothetical protein
LQARVLRKTTEVLGYDSVSAAAVLMLKELQTNPSVLLINTLQKFVDGREAENRRKLDVGTFQNASVSQSYL